MGLRHFVCTLERTSMQQGVNGLLAIALKSEQEGRPALPVGGLQVSVGLR